METQMCCSLVNIMPAGPNSWKISLLVSLYLARRTNIKTQLSKRPLIKAFWPITKCYMLVVTRLCRRPLRTWVGRSIKQRIDFEIHNVNLITEWRHHNGEKLQYSNTDAFSGLFFWDCELSCNQLFCFYLIWVDLLKGKPFSGNQCQKNPHQCILISRWNKTWQTF